MGLLETVILIVLAAVLLMAILYWYKKVPKAVEPAQIELRVSEREQRILKLYQNLEDLMDSFEGYVEEEKAQLAREFAETRARLGIPPGEAPRPASGGEAYRRPPREPAPSRIRPDPEPEVIVEIGGKADAPPVRAAPPLAQPALKPGWTRVEGGLKAPPPRRHSDKARTVLDLRAQGASPDEIAQRLNMAMGEVVLILGMYEQEIAQGT